MTSTPIDQSDPQKTATPFLETPQSSVGKGAESVSLMSIMTIIIIITIIISIKLYQLYCSISIRNTCALPADLRFVRGPSQCLNPVCKCDLYKQLRE